MLMDAIHALTDPAAMPATRRLRELESTVALHPTRSEHELSQLRRRRQKELDKEERRHVEAVARIHTQAEADGEATEARLVKERAEAHAEILHVRKQVILLGAGDCSLDYSC